MTDITGLGKVAEQLPALTKEVRELITILFKPSVEEVGGIFGDHFQRIRQRNAIRGLEKTQKILVQRGIQPQPIKPKLSDPILEGMYLEEDEDLQTMWAKLLAEAIKTNDIHPSYSSILKELSPLDAKILEYLFTRRNELYISVKFSQKSFYEIFPDAIQYKDNFIFLYEQKQFKYGVKFEKNNQNLDDTVWNYVNNYLSNSFKVIIDEINKAFNTSNDVLINQESIEESINNLCRSHLLIVKTEKNTLSQNIDFSISKLYFTQLGENFISIVKQS